MTSTVTTSTVSTVTTTAFFSSLVLIAIVTLLILLIKKEIFLSANDPVAARLRRVLDIAIIPLMMVFGMTVFVKLFEVFS